MTEQPAILTQEYLYNIDKELKDLPIAKFNKTASDAVVEKTKSSLIQKQHRVTVVASKEEALKFLQTLIPQKASISLGGSITLEEIGFVNYIKTRVDLKNYRLEAFAAQEKGDWAGAAAKRQEGLSADYFVSSVAGIAETGEIIGADATGTRVGPWAHSAKNIILVTGTNKITPTEADAAERLWKYQFPLENARVKIAYKVPGSSANNVVTLKAGNPYAPGRVHVVLIKGAFGY